jgi:hypothetical protein
MPGGVARAGAAEAQPEPARQRWNSVTTIAVILLGRAHPRSFLKSYFVFGSFLLASN